MIALNGFLLFVPNRIPDDQTAFPKERFAPADRSFDDRSVSYERTCFYVRTRLVRYRLKQVLRKGGNPHAANTKCNDIS